MKLTLRALALAVLMLAVATAASADSLTLVNGGNYTMGGVYVGPYNFTGSIGGQNVTLQLICDDFLSDVTPSESWQVNTSTFPSLSGVKWPLSTQQYDEMAYLAEQIFALNPSSSTYAQTLGDLQWALWNVMDPSLNFGASDPYGTISAADQINIQNDYNAAVKAEAGGPSSSFSNLTIYTPINGTQSTGGTPQEYFGDSPVPTPEPSTVLLLGIGLLGLIATARRKAVIA